MQKLLEDIDVEAEYSAIIDELEKASGDKRKKLIKRLETVDAFREGMDALLGEGATKVMYIRPVGGCTIAE